MLLGAIAGVDPADRATAASAGKVVDYRASLKADGLKGARIGVARKKYFGYSPSADKLIEDAIAEMKRQGAVIVDPADIPTAATLDGCEFDVLLYEFKADLNSYLGKLAPGAKIHSLADLIAFNARESDREMPFFGQETLIAAEKKGPLTSPAYTRALATCRTRSRIGGIDAVTTRLRLDAIVAPTGSPAWITDLLNGDHFLGASSTPAAVAGYPSITVPAGFTHGLPVGISFIGPRWSEARLIKYAYAYEQGTHHRKRTPVPDDCADGAAGGAARVGPRALSALQLYLDDGFSERAFAAKRRVRVLREKNHEVPFGNDDPRVWEVGEEPDIAVGGERAVRRVAFCQRAPSDVLRTRNRHLNVDVPAVRFETRAAAPTAVHVVDRDNESIAVQGNPAWRQRAEWSCRHKLERAAEEWVECRVA